jgi:hypothetical protein
MGYTYLSLQTGIEASAALGVTVMINTATNYRSGAELHFEGALNEHFPFGLAAGVGGYKQLTPDGGSGDMVGAFRGRVAAIGPLLSYTFREGTQEVTLSGRWFHEFDLTHRVQGNSILASLSFPLYNGAPQGLRRGREIGVCAATSAFGRPLPRRARQHGLRRVGRAH